MLAQVAKFIAVGVFNTLFGYSLYAMFIYLGLNYSLALLLATVLGVLFNFQTIGRFVFQSKNGRLIFRFVGVYALIFLINLALIKLMVNSGLSAYLAGGAALVPTTILSFLLNKYFVFKGIHHEAH